MKRITFLRIVFVLSIVLLTLSAAGQIHAGGPVKSKIRVDDWYTKGPSPDGPCSFPIDVHMTGMFKNAKWYDQNGTLVQEKDVYAGNRYTLHANEKSITVLNSGKIVYTYISPQETLIKLSGQEWVWIVPGHGVISGEVGQQVWSVLYDDDGNVVEEVLHKLVGNMLYTDVAPVVCDYLSP